jgi:hypothetical protein
VLFSNRNLIEIDSAKREHGTEIGHPKRVHFRENFLQNSRFKIAFFDALFELTFWTYSMGFSADARIARFIFEIAKKKMKRGPPRASAGARNAQSARARGARGRGHVNGALRAPLARAIPIAQAESYQFVSFF